MNEPHNFALYDRVQVSATATGTRESPTGWIDQIETFMNRLFVSVTYDKPTADGRTGITLTNIGLITKIK